MIVELFKINAFLYNQYCPMTFENEDANRLSSEVQIQNPYLPVKTVICGD